MQDMVSPKVVSQLSFEEIKDLLLQLYAVKTNLITERFTFHRLCQHQGQPIKEYLSELRTQANRYKFGLFLEEALTQLVYEITDNLRKRLLATEDLTYDKAANIATQHEMTDRDSQLFVRHTNHTPILASEICKV